MILPLELDSHDVGGPCAWITIPSADCCRVLTEVVWCGVVGGSAGLGDAEVTSITFATPNSLLRVQRGLGLRLTEDLSQHRPFSDTRAKTLFWNSGAVLQLQGAQQAWRHRASFVGSGHGCTSAIMFLA